MIPAALARDFSGKLSAMNAAPAAHSPPIPKPVRKRIEGQFLPTGGDAAETGKRCVE